MGGDWRTVATRKIRVEPVRFGRCGGEGRENDLYNGYRRLSMKLRGMMIDPQAEPIVAVARAAQALAPHVAYLLLTNKIGRII